MRGRQGPTPFTILTPVRPGATRSLTGVLERLAAADVAVLDRLPGVHFARWVLLDELAGRSSAAGQQLRMHYLLFTVTVDGTSDRFIEVLRTRLGPVTDEIWGHCINYPGHWRTLEFHRYMQHNSIPVSQRFTAYHATVEQVRAALCLRDQHITFALEAQQMDDKELLDSFRDTFDGCAR
ncbi:MAG: dyp-type peroxidase [Frankiales bacterium]|nr:dyp-type peroxidase [Frankiales bacterium]